LLDVFFFYGYSHLPAADPANALGPASTANNTDQTTASFQEVTILFALYPLSAVRFSFCP
jgi:hypothetical protein